MVQLNHNISKLNVWTGRDRMRILDGDFEHLAFEVSSRRFFPTSGEAYRPLDELNVELAGASTHNPPFVINRVSYPYHCAYFTISGEGRYVTEKREGKTVPGAIWVVPALCPHRYWAEREWTYLWVHFRDAGYWHSWSGLDEFTMQSHCFDLILRAANGLFEHGDRWGFDSAAEQWARLFTGYLEREFIFRGESFRHWQMALSRVWRGVGVDPGRSWTTDELAHMAHMSHTHLNRVMRKVHGMSIRRMLTKIRLENALILMRATRMTLDRIAEASGYSTSYALSKAFRREFGDSPRRVADRTAEGEIVKDGELDWRALVPEP